ncbi:MAG TPA: hypothetical protein VNF47_15195 [Streptosporangiaceae bacterium]|nr:hypothetical protein [Streptosporangiaceae bacterium]
MILLLASLLGLLGISHLGLSGTDALERDGLARGRPAPRWALADSAGVEHTSPPAPPLQLVVFADHSLKSFPSVVAGLRGLRDASDPADLELVILTRGQVPDARQLTGQLGLDGIAVIPGSPALYAGYNVRVMPFAIFVDSAGLVRASSLVNHDWQLDKLRQVALLPLEPAAGGPRAVRPPRGRLSRAAV